MYLQLQELVNTINQDYLESKEINEELSYELSIINMKTADAFSMVNSQEYSEEYVKKAFIYYGKIQSELKHRLLIRIKIF